MARSNPAQILLAGENQIKHTRIITRRLAYAANQTRLGIGQLCIDLTGNVARSAIGHEATPL